MITDRHPTPARRGYRSPMDPEFWLEAEERPGAPVAPAAKTDSAAGALLAFALSALAAAALASGFAQIVGNAT